MGTKSTPELVGDQTTKVSLSGDPAADRALWELSQILREIAHHQEPTTTAEETPETADQLEWTDNGGDSIDRDIHAVVGKTTGTTNGQSTT